MAVDGFVVSGDVDRATVPALRNELRTFALLTWRGVALDCANVSSIDGDGIRVWSRCATDAPAQGRRLGFVGLSDSLKQQMLRAASSSDVLAAERRRAVG